MKRNAEFVSEFNTVRLKIKDMIRLLSTFQYLKQLYISVMDFLLLILEHFLHVTV